MFAQQEDCNLIQYYRQGESGPVRASAQGLKDHFIQRRSQTLLAKSQSSRTVLKLTAEGMGREYLPAILWSETGPYTVEDKVVKRMLQCLTNTFPTQARLKQMGKADSDICRFCSANVAETLFHWQSECTQFSDARTRVHHDIWSVVFTAICGCLPEGWEYFKEVPARDIFWSVQQHVDYARRQPDGIFRRVRDVKHVLVDFTRGYGWKEADLRAQEDTKRTNYADFIQTLQERHTVEFFPLACGYNGAIAVSTWKALMNCLEINPKAQEKVLKLAVRAICIGFSTMVDIRHGCFRTTEQSSCLNDSRHI